MPSFAEVLYALPTDKLRALVKLRAVDTRKLAAADDKRSLVQSLSAELNRQPSTLFAIKQCCARELRLLQLIASVENTRGFTWDKLVEIAGGSEIESAIAPVMERLGELGLAFRIGDSIYCPEMVRSQCPASLSDRYTLARLLSMYDAPTIRRIAYKLGIEQEYSTKNANVEAICAMLLKGLASLRVNPPLTEGEIAVLEYLVQMGGSATPIEVANSVLDGHSDDFFRYEWQNRWKLGKERNAVDSLLARGIIFVTTFGYGYNFYLVIPGDTLLALTGSRSTGFWVDDPPAPVALEKQHGHTRLHIAVIRDIVCMLSFFAVQSATRTNTGHIHKSSLKTVGKMLSIADERYATFLYALCREAGMISPEGERQVYTITPRGLDWLRSDAAAQREMLFDAYRCGVAWSEMYIEPLMRSNDYRHRDVVIQTRSAVLELMSRTISTGEFVSIESFVSALAYSYPMLLSDCMAVTPGDIATFNAFARQLVTECLYWLGAVELYPSDAPDAPRGTERPRISSTPRLVNADIAGFRLTETGAALLRSGADLPSPTPREDKFVVQANAEVFVPPFLEPAILYRLMTLTDTPAQGAAGSQVTLTRESIRRAFDLGETPTAVLEFLQLHGRTPVPQNVEYLINEVGGKHGHIHVGLAQMYLRVDSPMLLKELQARRELKGYFVRMLTDTVAVLNATDIEKMLKELRKLGYLPVSDERHGGYDVATLTDDEFGPDTAPAKHTRKHAAVASDPYSLMPWDRFASDDSKPWHLPLAASARDLSRPQGAYDNPSLIRVMLHNASITHNVVDLVWREIGQEPVRTLFEPVSITGNSVRGYSHHSDDPLSLEIEMIRWARLTPDKF